jgi:bacterioferritin
MNFGEKMENSKASEELIDLLNDATAREMQVSVQYMLQHTLYGGVSRQDETKGGKFVGSHQAIYLPGNSLKKIAITEMKHAEAIAERVVSLGAKPTTDIPPFEIGDTSREILDIDRRQEEGAIELYRRVIELAGKEGDRVTEELFVGILSDEEGHHRTFVELLEAEK